MKKCLLCLPVIIFALAIWLNACSFLPTVTPLPDGYVATQAAATLSAMRFSESIDTPGVVYGAEGPGGPTATLPKAATATPRPSETFDPAATAPSGGSDDLISTAAAGLDYLLTSAPTLIPYLTEVNEDPVKMTEEVIEEAPEIGALAPDFSLVDAYSGEIVHMSDLRGQAVLINFWATWCVYCEDEMPAIQKAFDKYRQQGFVVLAIDVRENRNRARNFGERLNLSFNLLLDDDGAVANRYLVSTFPTTYFVARDGVITDIIIGAMKLDEIEWYVSSIVN